MWQNLIRPCLSEKKKNNNNNNNKNKSKNKRQKKNVEDTVLQQLFHVDFILLFHFRFLDVWMTKYGSVTFQGMSVLRRAKKVVMVTL